jgi:response regulator RpfG family c-di-GMP phosphodiesterase
MEVNEVTIGALVVSGRRDRRMFAEDDMIVLRTLTNAAAIAVHTAQLTQRFHEDYLELARAWAVHSDLRIWGRAGHTARVHSNALALASATDLQVALQPVLQVAAYLHDIALEAAGDDNWVETEPLSARHAWAGADWLARAGVDERVVALVRYHHVAQPEPYIGDAGADLGQASAILALVNYFDCWLLNHPEWKSLSPAELEEHVAADGGRCFAPVLLAELTKLWIAGRLVMP